MKPATRDRGIGIDAHGPFGSSSEWGTILEKMLQDSEWELTNGTRDFKLAIEAIVNADASSKANIDSFTDLILILLQTLWEGKVE